MKKMLSILLISLLFSCNGNIKEASNDKTKETNEFIRDFLDKNSTRIFNSEVQRARVNLFPKTNTLVYSFWNRHRLLKNGKFYLHLYPSDSIRLPEKRRNQGFINLSLRESELISNDSTNFFIIKSLQLPYDLDAIKTGQYTKNGKTWKCNFRKKEDLKSGISKEKNILIDQKRIFEILRKEKFKNIDQLVPNIGPIVSKASKKNKTSVFFNSNFNRLVLVFFDFKQNIKDKGDFYLEVLQRDSTSIKKEIDIDKALFEKNRGVLVYNLDIEANQQIRISQKKDTTNTNWDKVIDLNKFVFKPFPIRFSSVNEKLKNNDRNISIVKHLVSNNIPMVFYSAEKDIEVYFNRKNKKGYIISNKLEGFNELNIEIKTQLDSEMLNDKVSLKNTLNIKSENKEIVVYKIDLSEKSKNIQVYLNLDKKNKLIFDSTLTK